MSLETLPLVKLIELEHPHPADKQSAVEWARLLLQRNDWVVLDTETTGLDAKSEVIQVAILSPDNEVLLNSYVKPTLLKEIPAASTAVHGISMQMLAEAPTISDLLPRLEAVLEGKLIVCFNAAFDMRLLKQTIAMSPGRGNYLRLRSDCAMLAYSKFAGEWSDSKLDYKWQKLPSGDHSALGDCRATLSLIRQMANFVRISEQPAPAQQVQAEVVSGTTPSGKRSWLVPVCVVVLVLGLLLAGAWSHKSDVPSPVRDAQHETPTPVPGTESEGASGDTTNPQAVKAWNPINLPDNLKATFVTSLRPAGGVDFHLYVSGPANLTQAILDQDIPANVHLLDKDGKTIVGLSVAGQQWLKDGQGNLTVKDSVYCSPSEYGQMSAWEIQLRKVVPGPDPSTTATGLAGESPSPLPTSTSTPAAVKPDVVPEAQLPPTAPDIQKRPSLQGENQRVQPKSAIPATNAAAQDSQTSSDRFSKMEQEIFGESSAGLPASQRLERLELAVFRVAHPQDSVAIRLERLQRTLFGDR